MHKNNMMAKKLKKYKQSCRWTERALQVHERRDPFSGVWLQEGEEENPEVSEDEQDEYTDGDIEMEPIPTRAFFRNGVHGSSPPEQGEIAEGAGHAEGETVPTSTLSHEEGAEVLLDGLVTMMVEATTGGADGEEEENKDWIEEMEETPAERYQRYVQSAQCEVSDPDEWADIHYGPATASSMRSRSREATPVATPTPRSMPKALAQQRDRRLADERADAMVRQAEEERARRGTTLRSSSTKGAKGSKGAKGRTGPRGDDDVNFVMDSWAVATYFDISLVPRDEAAFDDFRWDLIMQGVGPETILVHNSPDLAHFISTCTNPVHRASLQRLRQSLQTLLVMFQSNSPQLWVEAAEKVRGWLESDRDWYYFAEGSTHHGEDEGEEESDGDADSPIDPQDRLPIPRDDDEDDRHGGRRSAGGGTSSSARPIER